MGVKSLRQFIIESTSLPTLYLDMDETLVNWYEGADAALVKYGFPKWNDPHWSQYSNDRAQELRWAILNKEPKFWLNLKFMPGGQQLWKFAQPYSPHILSHASEYSPTAVPQKRQWIISHLGLNIDAHIHLVLKRSDKQRFAINNGRPNILIDDYEKNCADWRSAGGIAIRYTSTANAISQLRKLGFK